MKPYGYGRHNKGPILYTARWATLERLVVLSFLVEIITDAKLP